MFLFIGLNEIFSSNHSQNEIVNIKIGGFMCLLALLTTAAAMPRDLIGLYKNTKNILCGIACVMEAWARQGRYDQVLAQNLFFCSFLCLPKETNQRKGTPDKVLIQVWIFNDSLSFELRPGSKCSACISLHRNSVTVPDRSTPRASR